MSEIKFAVVTAQSAREVWAYLPGNYAVFTVFVLGDERNRSEYLVAGMDVAGWTLEDYVIPRLRSGLIAVEAVTEQQAVNFAIKAHA